MEELLIKSNALVAEQSVDIIRPLASRIYWDDRLIGILGARGTGKTTLLLQRIAREYGVNSNAIYLSLDDMFFTANSIADTISFFITRGIDTFFIDEVHKYPHWAREIKNIYDLHKKIRIVFTGSCITDITRQNADLSRRAVQYELPGLSFREFLQFKKIANVEPLSLDAILENHSALSISLVKKFKPLVHFSEYIRVGYYPFFLENIKTYPIRVEQVVRMTIENDLKFIDGFDSNGIRRIMQLFYILAMNAPFRPNVSKLSERTGIHRNTLVHYLHYLERAKLINSLSAHGKSISILQKPEKIFLENTNLHYTLSPDNADKGSMREAFFLNQLRNAGHEVSLPVNGDFLIDGKHEFEIGGKNKSDDSPKAGKNFWIVNDDIETGALHKIPLWLFGMLY